MSESSSDNKSLKKGKLGVAGIVFFVVAAAAPLLGMTGAVPVAMFLGNGAGTVGTYLAVGVILLVFSVGYSAMSQKVTNTGAFFAYVGRGLGPKAGVASAFASLVGYITIQLAIYGFFGGVASYTFLGDFTSWWLFALIGWVLVTGLSFLSVDVGAKVLGGLMILELLSLVVTAIAIFAKEGVHVDLVASFSPSNIIAGGFAGGAGIAIAFAFASFIGFEATAIYGEESKDPKRTVPKATYWAIGIITGLFAFVSLAMATGMSTYSNPDNFKEIPGLQSGIPGYISEFGALDPVKGLQNPSGVLFHLADTNLGGTWMSSIMGILVLTSCFAGLLAFQNSIARYFFALGRSGVFSKKLAQTNASGAPVGGVMLTSAIAVAVIVAFWLLGLDGIANLFTWMSAVTAVAIMFVEILVSIAIVVYLGKDKSVNIWKSTIAPIVASLGLALGLYLLMSRFNLLGNLAPTGVDPTVGESAWQLTPLGWFLVLLPFIAAALGLVVAQVRNVHHGKMVDDVLS